MKIAAGEFKTHCLKLMDEVNVRRESIIITKRGKPVAKLVPVENERPPVFGSMKGCMTITGDIISPVGEIWNAEK